MSGSGFRVYDSSLKIPELGAWGSECSGSKVSDSGSSVWGSGFRVWGSVFRISGLGSTLPESSESRCVCCWGFEGQGSRLRVWYSGFRVPDFGLRGWGLGFMVWGS